MRSRWAGFQGPLAVWMRQFIDYKRALARRYHVEERALRLLDQYLVGQNLSSVQAVTPEVLEAFLVSRPRRTPRSYNHLLGTVARLFDWVVAQGFLGTSPLRTRPRRQTGQRTPFLFSPAQARKLLELASHSRDTPCAPMRATIYRTIFALLYGLGLRVGEVSRLCHDDVDLGRKLLVIRKTKFAKSRLVPFGDRLAAALAGYLEARRQRLGPSQPQDPVFSFGRNRAIHPGTISQTFHRLVPQLDLSVPAGVSPPRVHDLRHAFAVATLLRWYRAGINPTTRLLNLATFLGHVNPSSTSVYLTMTTELLHEANRRFETCANSLFHRSES